MLKLKPEGVTIVRDKETAKNVIKQLLSLTDRYHACDTEIINSDLKKSVYLVKPKVICASIYCGPDINFGSGPKIWIDNLDECEGVLDMFKEYFENENIKKVWHNYSFDKGALYAHGIDVKGFGGDTFQMARLWDSSRVISGGYSLQALISELLPNIKAKRTIKERFGIHKLKKDGSPGKVIVLPYLAELQRNKKYITDWIDYSTFDAEGLYLLRDEIEKRLKNMKWKENLTMWDFYQKHWLIFGELLTEIEKEGIHVNIEYLKEIEEKAIQDRDRFKQKFLEWAIQRCPDAAFMNIESDLQKQQFLFAPFLNRKTGKREPRDRDFHAIIEYVDPDTNKDCKKKITFTLSGQGLPVQGYTSSFLPSVSSKHLRALSGKNPSEGKFGAAFKHLATKEGEEAAKECCFAIDALVNSQSISTLLQSFIIPLQDLADERSRVHTSINVNTETGRLSSKKPNLQNQPALEKDKYKIRHAFTAEKGNMLIVADYSQLELRLLAHITGCKSMIEAFKEGGDFHSRTAISMYEEIAKEIEKGQVLLEWDYSKGKPPVPLLKEKYASERRRAKTLNFSIAYGKTAIGLAQDWGVTPTEAEKTLEMWYKDRPEVKIWQEKTIEEARKTGYTKTLLGRYRKLVDISGKSRDRQGHAERAAINTPLQGGAADVVICAMNKLYKNQKLKELGWKQILQIHDEIILEGPEETTQEVLIIVKEIMKNALDEPLLVDLDVEVKAAKSWYEAK